MNAKNFYGFILSFTVGVALESLFSLGYAFALLCVLVGVVLLLSPGVSRRLVVSSFVSLLCLACALGIFRVDVNKMKQDAHTLDMFLGSTVTLEGRVVEDPDARDTSTHIVLEVTRVFYNGQTFDVPRHPHTLVYAPSYPALQYGDRVNVAGSLKAPKNFTPDGGVRTFDYQAYLAKDDIFTEVHFPRVEILEHGQGNIIIGKLFAFKHWCLDQLKKNIPEPEASLAGGITLGVQASLGDMLLQQFRETGLSHIIVLSGYNIAIIVSAIGLLLVRLPFGVRIIVGMIAVVLFALMVGGGATVLRATVMILVVVFARALGRSGDALRALVLTGGLMILWNPAILLADVSFQLSFMATLALVVVSPILEPYFVRITSSFLREIVVSTIATQVFVLPLIIYYMGSVSLVGTLANILVLPMMPVAMLLSGLVMLVGWVPFAGSLVGMIAYGVLGYVIFVAEHFSKIPYASIAGVSSSLALLFVYYAAVAYMIKKRWKGEEVISRLPR